MKVVEIEIDPKSHCYEAKCSCTWQFTSPSMLSIISAMNQHWANQPGQHTIMQFSTVSGSILDEVTRTIFD